MNTFIGDIPKALAFDLDGTLTLSKFHLEENMASILGDLLEKFPIAIVSGASKEQFKTQFLNYFLLYSSKSIKNFPNLYLFPENGASLILYNNNEWRTVYENSFSEDESSKIILTLNNAIERFNLFEKEGFGKLIENRGAEITLSCLGQNAPIDIKQKWDPNQEKRKEIREYIHNLLLDYEVRIGGSTSIDITKNGMNKSLAINNFLKILNIKKNELIFLGDALFTGGNDEIVEETGVKCYKVDNPQDTINILRDIINTYEQVSSK